MMRVLAAAFLLVAVLWIAGAPAFAAEGTDDASAQELAGELLEEPLQELTEQAPVSPDEMLDMQPADWLRKLWDSFSQQVTAPLRVFVRLALVLVLGSVAMAPAGTGDRALIPVLELVCLLVCAAACVQPMQQLMEQAQQQLFYCRTSLVTAVPWMASLMAGGGRVASSAVFSGFFLSIVLLLSELAAGVVFPLMQILLALFTAAGVCRFPAMDAAASFCQRSIKWMLGLGCTLFVTLLGVQNLMASASDSLAMKTGKFLITSSVPIVGQAVSGAISALAAGTQLARGTAGLALIAIIGASFIPVLLSCLAFWAAFSAAGVIARTVECGRCAQLLRGAASCASLCGLTLLFYGLLVLLAILMMMLGG